MVVLIMGDESKGGGNEPDIYTLGAFILVYNFDSMEFQSGQHCWIGY